MKITITHGEADRLRSARFKYDASGTGYEPYDVLHELMPGIDFGSPQEAAALVSYLLSVAVVVTE